MLQPSSEVTFYFILYVLHVPSLRYLTVFIPFCLKSYLDCGEKNAKDSEASWSTAGTREANNGRGLH
ncbi:hypothetical protein ARMGADRAFT_168614 [Armillaria gallica]|uniref:Uncharacterized protein n=1 Tax=Armillaria gallica TaxID=47427 RepID=A0A2H3DME1_ARMGA|nr:hypothetical protein ARMGADRAFT_168614 [Armillaria gallica]